MGNQTRKNRRGADLSVPLQSSVPESVIRRLDWLLEKMQTSDPSVCRSHLVARFLTEKLNDNQVPVVDK